MGLPNYARFITGVAANRQPSLIRGMVFLHTFIVLKDNQGSFTKYRICFYFQN